MDMKTMIATEPDWIRSAVEKHREWIESVQGVTLERMALVQVSNSLTSMAARQMFNGVSLKKLNHGPTAELRAAVTSIEYPKDLPPEPRFEAGWQIGKPDVVFEMPVAFEIPESGEIPYQYFEVPTNFKEDTWVQAVESRYGDPAHVHHLIVSVLPPENRRARAENAIQVKSINLPGQQVNIRQRTSNCATCPGRETGLTEEQAASQRRAGAIPLVTMHLAKIRRCSLTGPAD